MKGSKLSKSEIVSGFKGTSRISWLKVKGDAVEEIDKALRVA